MKSTFAFLFLLLFSLFNSQDAGEQKRADDLQKSFRLAKTDHEKAIIQMKLSDYWSFRDTAKAFLHLREANRFIGNSNFLKGVSQFYKAGIYYAANAEKAQLLYMDSENILKKIQTRESYGYRAKLWHNYASLEQQKGNGKTFLNITIEKCIPFSQKAEKLDLLAGYYADVGLVFYNYKEYEKSVTYFNKGIDVLEKTDGNDETASWLYLNLANTYLETEKNNEAWMAIRKAENYLKKNQESQYVALLYQVKSKYYNSVKDPEMALQTIQKGIDFSKLMNLDYDYLTLNFEKFRLLKGLKKYMEAREVLFFLLKDKKITSTKNRLVFLNEISEIEKQLGHYPEALGYLRQFQVLNDSVHAENEKIQIINLEAKYKTKEQQKALEYLENKNLQQRIIFLVSFALLLVTSVFVFYFLNQRKKMNDQKVKTREQNLKNEIKEALVEGEIQERERIAKDLHDGIGGRITGIKISLEHLAQKTNNKELGGAVHQLEACLSDIRHTARNLTPETLKKFGLEEALKDFCQSLNSEKLKVSCYVNQLNANTAPKTQIQIFRIVQEAVSNAVKHSNASAVLVQCTAENGLLLVEVEDDGKGFLVNAVNRNLGLNNIEKRTKLLNGKLEIDSEPGAGTTIRIEANI